LSAFSQDTINENRDLWSIEEVDLIYVDSIFDFLVVDLETQIPIEGWLVSNYEKNISAEHYSKGLEDGPFAWYELKKGRFHLVTSGFSLKGDLLEKHDYDWRKRLRNSKLSDLKKVKTFDPKSRYGNIPSSRIILFKKHKLKIKDRYYIKENHKKRTSRYIDDWYSGLLHPKYLDSIISIFPPILNSWQHPFTHLRFDGYYDLGHKLRFYSDSSAVLITWEKSDSSILSWENPENKRGYFTLCNNQIEVSLDNNNIYGTGRFYSFQLLMIEMRLYTGVTLRFGGKFIPVSGYNY